MPKPGGFGIFPVVAANDNLASFSEPASPAEFRETWWAYIIATTVLGMVIGEIVRPFIRKGPIF